MEVEMKEKEKTVLTFEDTYPSCDYGLHTEDELFEQHEAAFFQAVPTYGLKTVFEAGGYFQFEAKK